LVIVTGAEESVASRTWYCFHADVTRGTVALAYTVPVSLSTSTVSGPVNPLVAFAKNEAVYVSCGLTGTP
jgi:hypothetical protein